MAKLAWGLSGTRHFEAGTDRGVLYVDTNPGVPWNGLVSVSEKPSGGEPRPYYLDGVKYLNLAAMEEFAATISAISSPPEFDVCDGSASLANGLFVTQQRRKPFSLTYRTLVGNDTAGIDFGYKIHLVYHALSKPATRDNKTIEKNTTPLIFGWDVSTLPELSVGYRPSSHFIVDTRKADPLIVGQLESILYGTDIDQPRIPTTSELVNLFAS